MKIIARKKHVWKTRKAKLFIPNISSAVDALRGAIKSSGVRISWSSYSNCKYSEPTFII